MRDGRPDAVMDDGAPIRSHVPNPYIGKEVR
jgi:hypothetical protein